MNDEINDKINKDLINTCDTNKRIKNLEKKMELILEKLEKLEQIEENCSKMGNHITFVETVYETVRAPLQFISNKLSGNYHVLPLKDHDRNNGNNIKY